MFNKTSKPTPPVARPQQPTPPPMAQAPAASLARAAPVSMGNTMGMSSGLSSARPSSSIGSGLVIEGNVSGSGDLLLEGTVRGDVKVAHLIVGEAGNIEGKVEAETIEVRGRIVGSIAGKQIKLQATAYVEGDITHEQLAIDVGAYFQGRCLQSRRAEPAPAPVVSPVASAPEIASPSVPTLGTPSLGSYDADALADLK